MRIGVRISQWGAARGGGPLGGSRKAGPRLQACATWAEGPAAAGSWPASVASGAEEGSVAAEPPSGTTRDSQHDPGGAREQLGAVRHSCHRSPRFRVRCGPNNLQQAASRCSQDARISRGATCPDRPPIAL